MLVPTLEKRVAETVTDIERGNNQVLRESDIDKEMLVLSVATMFTEKPLVSITMMPSAPGAGTGRIWRSTDPEVVRGLGLYLLAMGKFMEGSK